MPTATEVFHLRSECAALAEKIYKAKEDDLQPWLQTAQYAWWHSVDQLSRYDPNTNRCYAELTIRTTSRKDPAYEDWSVELYDGQTKEMLASTRHQVNSGSLKKEEDSGMVYVSAPAKYDDTFKGTTDYINDAMQDDRTR